jgi:phosphoglucomutase
VLATLPTWASTSVFEARAALKVGTADKTKIKARYAGIFAQQWEERKKELARRYGISSWKAFATQGLHETEVGNDFGSSGTGGLRIVMYQETMEAKAFLWMRGSGTEPVFRIMADIAEGGPDDEAYFLAWHTDMVRASDSP